jgi:hypothetical protein
MPLSQFQPELLQRDLLMPVVLKPEEHAKIALSKDMILMQIFANIAEQQWNYINDVDFLFEKRFIIDCSPEFIKLCSHKKVDATLFRFISIYSRHCICSSTNQKCFISWQ